MNQHYKAAAEAKTELPNEEISDVHYISERGLTDEVMQYGALNRIAEATLALAYEQRTANLIAYATSIDDTDTAVFAQIKERLDRPEPPKPEPVKHYRVGAGRCNCGFDAYRISGIMIDYSEELAIHLRGNR